jgi:hypothetical protein
MKTIHIPNGILHLSESRARCPHCTIAIPFESIDEKYMKQDNLYIRHKCKCKRYMGITQDIRGDYVAFSLSEGKDITSIMKTNLK